MSKQLVLLLSLAGLASADSIVLRNGQTVNGSFSGATSRTVRFDQNGRTSTMPISDVQQVEFGTVARQTMPNTTGQDRVVLRNGASYQGTMLSADGGLVRMATGDRVQSFELKRVARIEFADQLAGTTAGSNTQADNSQSTGAFDRQNRRNDTWNNNANQTTAANNNNGSRNNTRPNGAWSNDPYQSTSWGAEIPAGTRLAVRMIDDIDSDRDQVGQTYRASLAEPLTIDGRTVIPQGADVVVQLMQEEQAGTFSGRPTLTMGLQSISVNGRPVQVTSETVEQAGSSRGQRSAMVIGGGAALGAILGAIAGGGKGAAIGAAAGAGAGTAAQVIFRGSRVRVPSETVFNFALDRPVRI
jgi:hypothetical protein